MTAAVEHGRRGREDPAASSVDDHSDDGSGTRSRKDLVSVEVEIAGGGSGGWAYLDFFLTHVNLGHDLGSLMLVRLGVLEVGCF